MEIEVLNPATGKIIGKVVPTTKPASNASIKLHAQRSLTGSDLASKPALRF
jgi:hypothetical protein